MLKSQSDALTALAKAQDDRLAASAKSQDDRLTVSLWMLENDASQRRLQVAQVAQDLQSLKGYLETTGAEGKQRDEQVVKNLQDAQSEINGIRRDAKQAEGHMARLSASIQVPPDDRLTAVLLLFDSGQRMSEYEFPAVRQAVFQAVEAALRQTPRRKIGVAANRGDRVATLLTPDVHYLVPDLEDFRKELAAHQAAAGEESNRLAGVQGALNLLAPRGGRWRLVYVTCTPLRRDDPQREKWQHVVELSRKFGIEFWAVHLLNKGDEASPDLVDLAAESGGQYVGLAVKTAPASDAAGGALKVDKDASAAGGGQPASFRQRLLQLLFQALDLPPAGRAEP